MRMDAALLGDRSGTGCPPALLNSHNSFSLEGLYILGHTYIIACTKSSHGNIRAIVPLGNTRHPARQHSPETYSRAASRLRLPASWLPLRAIILHGELAPTDRDHRSYAHQVPRADEAD